MTETYEIRIQARFNAVHRLRMSDGTVEPLHGHDWRVEAVFRGEQLPDDGMLIDFEVAAAALRQVLAGLEHQNLNELPAFKNGNPSTERVARWIFQQLIDRFGSDNRLAAVYVEEAPGCIAGYLRQDS